jgi:phosphoserine phosphatase
MDGGIGTRYVVEDGAYTGALDGPFVYGKGKVIAIEEIAGQTDLDLESSWAYSDSASDLPMLELVGNAVAVNPDAPLLEVARREGWQVMRFERLGRNLAIGGTIAGALLVGGLGGWLSRRNT